MTLFELLSKYSTLEEMPRFANRQGVAGLLYEEVIASGKNPFDKRGLMRLSGYAQKRQKKYFAYKESLARLAKFYRKYGIGMVVLKGYGCSLNWPVPDYRPTGDIDVYLFDLKTGEPAWEKGDKLIRRKLGISVSDSHEHHTCFSFEGLMVENHYDFINAKAHKSSRHIEAKLKSLANSFVKNYIESGEDHLVYMPSPQFNSIFLLRHMAAHFSTTNMTMRQLLDWAFFVDKYSEEVDWEDSCKFFEEMNLTEFFNLTNAICVDYLGFDAKKFTHDKCDKELEKRIVDDMMDMRFLLEKPDGNFFQVIWYKISRFRENAWKRKLVVSDEPLWMDFIRGSFFKLKRWDTIDEKI